MDPLICRDCGLKLTASARGCPQCALNFEAEDMIDRIVWRRAVPILIGAVVVLVALFFFLR